ncbi:hypothetical protein PPERSA_09697 [Pseudocohnilembus persalinus]|uniref:B box-type domain-containing protein n=1 Tax=Pseudocohnilembus persalinus TaxID=266149 RepID=A0A0V0QW24_PSEPJ|nr:hypothetical protein PPERSA_09697 [Pseudocohnilembus persalinus]|eukprot:KRX06085.1 hypothetical protein PPERSA_09697 [Pseudocohnilembus persalinus]
METEFDQQAQQCSLCENFPDDILMLACNHDLCLQCAASSYYQEHDQQFKQNYLTCTICKEITHLDHSSVYELEKIAIDINQSQNESNFQQLQTEFSQGSPETNGVCQEHEDEELSYFCFDCKSNCICAECVIHGTHKNHNVKTLKKAFPEIKEQLQDYLGNLEYKSSLINQRKLQLDGEKQDIQEQNQFLKKQVSKIFSGFLEKVRQKEEEILQSCEYLNDSNTKEINNFLINLQSKINDLQQSKAFIQQNIQDQEQDEVKVLNFFSDNYQMLGEILVEDEYEKKLLNEKIEVNILDVKDIEKQIQNIQKNLKGVEGSVKSNLSQLQEQLQNQSQKQEILDKNLNTGKFAGRSLRTETYQGGFNNNY